MTAIQGALLAVVLVMTLVWTLGRHNIPSDYRRGYFFVYMALVWGLVISIMDHGDERGEREEKATVATVEGAADEARHAAFDLHRAQKWPQAIAAYDTLVKRGGEDAEILYWRGIAHWKSAQFDQAYRDFRRVIDLDPANLEAYRNADRLLARQQKWDEIITMWNWYISRQPPNADAHYERGGTYFHKGDIAAARADAARACELGKNQGCRMAERLKSR
jgi:tetratricopeptide (TPR) repeat protein